MIPFEYRIPDSIVRYYRNRYGRDLQVGDVIPAPHGRAYTIVAMRKPAKVNG